MLARWVAYVSGLGGTFAVLSLTVPPARQLEALGVELIAIASCAVASVLWLRAARLQKGMAVMLMAGCVVVSVVAVVLASNPPSGAYIDLRITRREWLMLLGSFMIAAIAIRRLVTELRDRAEQLAFVSRTDQLTGVANRRAWDEEVPREVERARRDGLPLCVAVLEVDRLKAYNEMRGHREGDRLLQRVADGWRSGLRSSDFIARHEAESFAILLRRCSMDSAVAILQRLRRMVPEEQTASAGVARWDGRETAEQLVQRAGEALHAAKTSGRDRVKISDIDPETTAAGTTDWRHLIHRVLTERGVVAVYQPIVTLSDGEVRGYEALARPNRQLVDLGVERMFAAAQEMGLARELDWLCRRAALEGAAAIPPGVPVFVNCNVSGLVDPVHRVDQMLLLLRYVRRSPRDVVMEITEREIVGDLGRLRSVVDAYRQEGFRFAIDDVGEGHSTLEVLAATQPEFVKIARSLVVSAGSTGPRAAIRAVVAFARETGASVIAEGLELAATARLMHSLDVDLGQGYLFARPALLDASPVTIQLPVGGSRSPVPAASVDDTPWTLGAALAAEGGAA
jgi:diguanylate cyclase (GGDEF)-like protein